MPDRHKKKRRENRSTTPRDAEGAGEFPPVPGRSATPEGEVTDGAPEADPACEGLASEFPLVDAAVTESVSILLRQMRDGDPAARSRLFELIYSDLHVRAANFVRGGGGTSLSANSLLHELFVKFMGLASPEASDRQHLIAYLSRTMGHILADQARRRGRAKRTAPGKREPLDDFLEVFEQNSGSLVELDDELNLLRARDPDAARAVDLRFFGGLSTSETAAALGMCERTFERRWREIKAYLHYRMRRDDDESRNAS
jgi:RNA polymerase sigma factor (TIGR02999 family)